MFLIKPARNHKNANLSWIFKTKTFMMTKDFSDFKKPREETLITHNTVSSLEEIQPTTKDEKVLEKLF